jgi:hypothetical protein
MIKIIPNRAEFVSQTVIKDLERMAVVKYKHLMLLIDIQ